MSDVIRIGTRKSPLAMAQAEEVSSKLTSEWPDIACEIVPIISEGDKFLDQPLADIGGKGLFTKELEHALLKNEIDIAVHSMKDVPNEFPDGLILPCILPREDARDVFISKEANKISELPENSKFGTSSLRRASQVLHLRPDIMIVPMRGNVQTRLTKLENGDAEATMLALAGLNRLGITSDSSNIIPMEECLPAVGQGAIGIECRKDDVELQKKLEALHCKDSWTAVMCERAFLRVLDGSCRTPIAGYAAIDKKMIQFTGLLATPDGKTCERITAEGKVTDAEMIGAKAGEAIRLRVF